MNTVSPTTVKPGPQGLSEEQYAKAVEFAASVTPTKRTLATEGSLPKKLTKQVYARALDFAKLASQTYDWDDAFVASIGMNLFDGIEDVKKQEFRTPDYVRVRRGGGSIDWLGGGDDDYGLDYTVFQHKVTQDIVLAFRGTEPLSVEDWIEDIKQAFGGAKQYRNAVNLAKSLAKKVKEHSHRLFLTGHSLGGGLATAAALATGCEAIVFDSAGVSQATIDSLQLNVKNKSKVTNFNVRECFVSDHNKLMDDTTIGTDALGVVGTQKQYGAIFWLESVSDRANFRMLPDWTRTAKWAESVLSHAWHVFTFQLEHKKFVHTPDSVEDDSIEPLAKKQRT